MITYPRTDSKALPEDYPETCRKTLKNLDDDLAATAKKVVSNNWINAKDKRVFNNKQVSDHFAIIPTAEKRKKLKDDEAKIFDMIARRFIAIFYPSAEYNVTTRLSEVEDQVFKTEGKVLVSPGWLEVYGKSTEGVGEKTLPQSAMGTEARARPRLVISSLSTSKQGHRLATRKPLCCPRWKGQESWLKTMS